MFASVLSKLPLLLYTLNLLECFLNYFCFVFTWSNFLLLGTASPQTEFCLSFSWSQIRSPVWGLVHRTNQVLVVAVMGQACVEHTGTATFSAGAKSIDHILTLSSIEAVGKGNPSVFCWYPKKTRAHFDYRFTCHCDVMLQSQNEFCGWTTKDYFFWSFFRQSFLLVIGFEESNQTRSSKWQVVPKLQLQKYSIRDTKKHWRSSFRVTSIVPPMTTQLCPENYYDCTSRVTRIVPPMTTQLCPEDYYDCTSSYYDCTSRVTIFHQGYYDYTIRVTRIVRSGLPHFPHQSWNSCTTRVTLPCMVVP